jgi:hypothetical protein
LIIKLLFIERIKFGLIFANIYLYNYNYRKIFENYIMKKTKIYNCLKNKCIKLLIQQNSEILKAFFYLRCDNNIFVFFI